MVKTQPLELCVPSDRRPFRDCTHQQLDEYGSYLLKCCDWLGVKDLPVRPRRILVARQQFQAHFKKKRLVEQKHRRILKKRTAPVVVVDCSSSTELDSDCECSSTELESDCECRSTELESPKTPTSTSCVKGNIPLVVALDDLFGEPFSVKQRRLRAAA